METKEAAAILGRKGGKSTSEAKVNAVRENGKLGGNKTGERHYYAEHSYMGLNYTYDSPCWMVYVFDSKTERDEWLKTGEYNQSTGNYVARACSFATACKIAPDLRKGGDYHDMHRVNY
jgi:hypothetical protein